MKFDRQPQQIVAEGREADLILGNPRFVAAVNEVLNRYTEIEEACVSDKNLDVQEMQQRVMHNARMRTALMDVVNKLNDIVREGENHRDDY